MSKSQTPSSGSSSEPGLLDSLRMAAVVVLVDLLVRVIPARRREGRVLLKMIEVWARSVAEGEYE